MDARRKTLLIGLVTVAAIVCGAVAWRSFSNGGPDLPAGVTRVQYDQAVRTWHQKHARAPDQVDLLAVLGDALVVDDATLDAAVACYDEIPTEHLHGPGARVEAAKALMRLNRGREAERNLRALIDHVGEASVITHQQFVEALDMLRFLLEVQLRFEERKDVLRVVHLIGEAGTFETMAYCFPTLLRWNGPQSVQWLETLWQADPEDLSLRVALGRYRSGEGKLDEAEAILLKCVQQNADNLYAQAALAACYYEQDDWDKIKQALKRLPPRKATDPWLLSRLRGHLHNHEGHFEQAVACFEQVLAADPANSESWLGLARAWRGLKRETERQEALRKSQVMARIQNRLGGVLAKEPTAAALFEIVALCEEIALADQALLVARLALKIEPTNAEANNLVQRLASSSNGMEPNDMEASPDVTTP